MSINTIVHSEQQEDGEFKHYVVFGNQASWDAEPENCVECAGEQEAFKLQGLLKEPPCT